MSLYLSTFVKTHNKTCYLQIKSDERIISNWKSWYGGQGRWRRYLMNIICHRRVSQVFTRGIRYTLSHFFALFFLRFQQWPSRLLELMTSQALVLLKTCWTNTSFLCSPGDNRNSSFAFEKIQCIINKTVNDIIISCKRNIIVNRIQLWYSYKHFKLSFNT